MKITTLSNFEDARFTLSSKKLCPPKVYPFIKAQYSIGGNKMQMTPGIQDAARENQAYLKTVEQQGLTGKSNHEM